MKNSASHSAALDFLSQLYGGCREGVVFLTGEATRWEPVSVRLRAPDALQYMAERAIELGDVRASVAIYRDGSSRGTGNVLQARAAMVDLDDADLADVPVEPSILIASGGSTDGRPHRHGVWLLDRAVDVPELAELQRGLRDNTGGDPDWNAAASSLVRIPGTVHRKAGKLRRVELVKGGDQRHAPDQLRELCPPKVKATTTTSILPPAEIPADLSSAIAMASAQVLGKVERGDLPREPAGYSLACEARRLGANREQAAELLIETYWRPVQSIPRDHTYYEQDLRGSIGRAFKGSAQDGDRRRDDCQHFDPADMRRWSREALADPSLSKYEKWIVIELERRMLGAGARIVTAGTRSLALALDCTITTISRALNGTKTRPGLYGRWIRKAKRGAGGAQRWAIKRPQQQGEDLALGKGLKGLSNPSFPANCPTAVIPPHDAFAFHALGLSIRSTLAVLAASNESKTIPELASSHFLGLSDRTIRRHVNELERFDLASRTDGHYRAELDDLDQKLDQVAKALGTAGRADRLRRRFAEERKQDRKRRAAFGQSCAEERKARARQRIGRRSRARRRRERLARFGPLPAKASR